MTRLFDPFPIRDTTIRNRVWLSPMCQYSAVDGMPNDWHFVHLGKYAVGGVGLVLTEATAVTAEGRISPGDTGIWTDAQAEEWGRIVRFVQKHGATPGIQLAHAGRKASTRPPWEGPGYVEPSAGGWATVGPSEVPFDGLPTPRPLTVSEIDGVVEAFAAAARRADAVGFEVAEIHAAHGYLLHEFLSPLSNIRHDEYGGSFENRVRLLLEVTDAVRAVWPDSRPVLVRISATDWVEGGWDIHQSVEVARLLAERGVDLIDCSSGGSVGAASIPVGPNYQVPFAERIRREAGIATGAVGLITDVEQADTIIAEGRADAVLMAREMLRQPNWAALAADELGLDPIWPPQYERAKRRRPR